MADGTYGYVAILLALQRRWGDINYGSLRETIEQYRDGTESVRGSENYGTLAYGAAVVIAWKRPDRLSRLGITRGGLIAWWERELQQRLERGLQLNEARSRIYCIFSQAIICWLRRAFEALGLADLHLRYVKATAAQVALCSYPVRPVRLKPDATDNPWPVPISVPLCGARSLEVNENHHMLHSAYEMFAAELLGLNWSRGGGSQTEWARDVIRLARPGRMGMSAGEVGFFERAILLGRPMFVGDFMEWLDGVGTRWPCRLIRFERGAACIGLGRSINGNTAPLFAMATHQDGTVRWLGVHGRSHRVDAEPCGVNEFDHGDDRVKYVAWAGGEDWPRKELVLHPDRWGKVLWDVHIQRDGNHVVRRPSQETPEPPGPGPEPEPPDDDPSWWSRYRYRAIAGAVFLTAVVLGIRGCF